MDAEKPGTRCYTNVIIKKPHSIAPAWRSIKPRSAMASVRTPEELALPANYKEAILQPPVIP
jgi:hypothetical protein